MRNNESRRDHRTYRWKQNDAIPTVNGQGAEKEQKNKDNLNKE